MRITVTDTPAKAMRAVGAAARGGYTLIEFIVVLAVLGILSARLSGMALNANTSKRLGLVKQTEQLRRDIAHIQALALNTGAALRLNIGRETSNVCTTTASGTTCTQVPSNYKYWVTCPRALAATPCVDTTSTVLDPVTKQELKVVLEDGLTLSATDGLSVSAVSVDFDSVGRPVSGPSLIASNPARTFTLSGGGKSGAIALRPITGLAEVSY